MSVLNKIPFINNVLAHLSDEELKTLLSLMNGLGDRTELNRILGIPSGNRTNISAADKGVHMCSLQIGPTLFQGYLLYSDFACVLLTFTDFQIIVSLNIDVANNNYEKVTEYLDINELRSQVNDLLTEAGELGDIVAKMEVSDITAMTKDQLDKLEPGDVVNKITNNMVHSYHVSYKGTGAGQGICLTYSAAGYLETVSYDRSGNDWVYNSTDVCDISSSGGGTEVIANPTLAGTESDLTGLQVGDTKYKISNELPDTTGASSGNVLSLDSNKNPQWSAPAAPGSTVVVNPTLAGTESDLTGLEVDGVKYAVPQGGGGGGGSAYSHDLLIKRVNDSSFSTVYCYTRILTNSSSPITTITELHNALTSLGVTPFATGWVKPDNTSAWGTASIGFIYSIIYDSVKIEVAYSTVPGYSSSTKSVVLSDTTEANRWQITDVVNEL